MTDAGLIVLVSFISPFRSERRMAREFVEIFVDSPYEAPEHPEPHIDTASMPVEDAAELIVAYLAGTREVQ